MSGGVRPAPPDIADLELEKALLSVSVLLVMLTPIVDPEVVSPVAPSSYQDFSTPGGSRQPDHGCVSVIPHFARLLSLRAGHLPDHAVLAGG